MIDYADGDQKRVTKSDNPASAPVDLADKVKGMYRLLDLISESGSNGYGMNPRPLGDGFMALIRLIVDKVIIAQDSLQRFINAMSPGAYASITKVDFKTLDQLAIKPRGIYGCKNEIVRLLQSLGAVDEKLCVIYLTCLQCFSLLSEPACCSCQVMLAEHSHPGYTSSRLARPKQQTSVTTSSTGPKTRPGMTRQHHLWAATE
jgi:hypothetical protein